MRNPFAPSTKAPTSTETTSRSSFFSSDLIGSIIGSSEEGAKVDNNNNDKNQGEGHDSSSMTDALSSAAQSLRRVSVSALLPSTFSISSGGGGGSHNGGVDTTQTSEDKNGLDQSFASLDDMLLSQPPSLASNDTSNVTSPSSSSSTFSLLCLRCRGTVEGPRNSTCKCEMPALTVDDLASQKTGTRSANVISGSMGAR